MASGIWVRLVKHNHIEKDATENCTHEAWEEALTLACRRLDVPRPLLLPRHQRDFAQFSQTRFLPDHFMEAFPFDRMEVEFIDPEKKKKINEKYL